MPFHEDVDSIVQNHIEQITKLEEREADKILKTYRQIRQSLRDRLDTIPGETFTAQRLRGVLLQVETAVAAMARGMHRDFEAEAPSIAEEGIKDLEDEIRKFEKKFVGAVVPIHIGTIRVANDTSNFLVNRYEASLRSYSDDIRNNIARGLTEAAIEEITVDEAIRRVGKFFLAEEWRLRRIVRTEIHNIYNHGKIFGMKELKKTNQIPDLKKTLIHPMDHRTGDDSKALAEDNLIVEIDKPFRYVYKGKERVFMAPPDRPNDRSVLVPYRKAWDN